MGVPQGGWEIKAAIQHAAGPGKMLVGGEHEVHMKLS
jgi:hypothetical protein